MAKHNFFYLAILVIIFFGFFTVLDQKKANAGQPTNKFSSDILGSYWTVAEVKEIHTAKDVSEAYQAIEFQFLSSGGFVELDEKLVHKTGSWHLINNKLEIKYDDVTQGAETYLTEMVEPNELLLLNEQLQLRLLKTKL